MYIKITSEIVNEAIAQKDSRAYEVLKMLDWCVYLGHHFVHGDLGTLLQIRFYFRKDFTHLSRLYTTYSIDSETAASMQWHLEFITDHDKNPLTRKEEVNHTIYVNVNSNFEAYRECHLLAENLDDIKMFEHIVAYYKRLHGLQKAHISYYRLLGGGSTTKDVYESDILLKKALILCIVDSDKHYPNAALGDTAKQLREVERAHNHPFNSYYYIMERVLEIENLVPYNLYERYCQGKTELEDAIDAIGKLYVKDKNLLAYYDYKNGITPILFEDKNNSNNTEEIARLINTDLDKKIAKVKKTWDDAYDFLQTVTYLTPHDRDRIFKKSKKDDYYIPGLGGKILSHILETLDTDLKKIQKVDLSDAQQIEYDNVGKILYNWTCASEMKRL